MDDMTDSIDPGLAVARRLEAYADLRLSPSVAATTRMRTSVMNDAQRRAALIQADPMRVAARPVRSPWRRPVAALLAASLAVGILAGTAFAAKPGGPLYAASLWIEMANLPTDPVARAAAEVSRLEERLLEAQQASRDGNGPAVQAALAAYSTIVADASEASTGDPAESAALEATVTRHISVLTLLVDSVPAPARAAVEHALSSSTKVVDDIKATGGNDGQPGTTGQPANTAQPGKPEKTTQPGRPGKTAQPGRPGNGQGGQGGAAPSVGP